jgi:hypothetical protein
MNDKKKIILNYFDKKVEINEIYKYQEFLNQCYKLLELSEEEISTLKIYKLDEGDEISIENENDYNENLNVNENNQIIFVLKSKLKEKKKNNKLKFSQVNQVHYNILSEDNLQNNNNNNRKMYNSVLSNEKISDKNENEKIKKDNSVETKKEIDVTKSVKKSINDIKTFLVGLDETLNNRLAPVEKLFAIIQNQNTNVTENNKYLLEEMKNEFNEKINLLVKKNISLENQIGNLTKKIENYSKEFINLKQEIIELKNENVKFANLKEKEENQFYQCNFIEENYTINYSYDKIMQLKNFTFKINLINNGNLPWPKKSFIYGKSNMIEIKSIINNNEEILPQKKISIPINVNLNKIKNENIQISFPLKLCFPNNLNNNFIIQNQFLLNLIIKESNKQDSSLIDDYKPIKRKRIYNTPKSDEFNVLNDLNKNKQNENYEEKNPKNQNIQNENQKKILWKSHLDNVHEVKRNENLYKSQIKNFNTNYLNENNFHQFYDNNNENFKIKNQSDVSDNNENINNDNNYHNNINKTEIKKKENNSNKSLLSNYIIKSIKKKLEEDYSYGNFWDDEILKTKINKIMNEKIKQLLIDEEEEEAIEAICELIGDELLEEFN